jgi:hypothetical protein
MVSCARSNRRHHDFRSSRGVPSSSVAPTRNVSVGSGFPPLCTARTPWRGSRRRRLPTARRWPPLAGSDRRPRGTRWPLTPTSLRIPGNHSLCARHPEDARSGLRASSRALRTTTRPPRAVNAGAVHFRHDTRASSRVGAGRRGFEILAPRPQRALRPAVDPPLRCVVGGATRPGDPSGDRRNVDQVAFAVAELVEKTSAAVIAPHRSTRPI